MLTGRPIAAVDEFEAFENKLMNCDARIKLKILARNFNRFPELKRFFFKIDFSNVSPEIFKRFFLKDVYEIGIS